MPHKVSPYENIWGFVCLSCLGDFLLFGAFLTSAVLRYCKGFFTLCFIWIFCFSANLLAGFMHAFYTKDKPLCVLQPELSLGSLLLSNSLVSTVGTNF